MKEILHEYLKLVVLFAPAALIYGVAVLIHRFRAKKGEKTAAQAAIGEACAVAKKLLDQVLFGALTAAERERGGGTGAEKLDIVREKVLALLPEKLRPLVPVGWLKRAIEDGLAAAKKKWVANPALLAETASAEAK